MKGVARSVTGALAVVMLAAMVHPVAAVERQRGAVAAGNDIESVMLIPELGATIGLGRWEYGGSIEITAHRDGLAVIETVTIDDYLAGVREVPLSWPAETLKAQVVAARTYLAWTLERGRSSGGEQYDYDICATTACQVYAGTSVVGERDGARWLDAIAATGAEVLLWDGKPAQTLYSSSAGSRTRAVEDVFGGVAKPYLRPVESPEAGVTPYEAWAFTLDVEAFRRILGRAGYEIGADVFSIEVDRPGEGGGPATMIVTSDSGRIGVPVHDVRWLFNDIGPRLYPGLLPAPSPHGGRWPQTVLSYTFHIEHEPGRARPAPPHLPPEDVPAGGTVTFRGEGWGHGVGMSQWGAKALGDRGAGYEDILAHYYSGLRPHDGTALLPDTVRVGLVTGATDVTVQLNGDVEIRINGVPVGVAGAGEWSFLAQGDSVGVVVPIAHTALGERIAARPWPR